MSAAERLADEADKVQDPYEADDRDWPNVIDAVRTEIDMMKRRITG